MDEKKAFSVCDTGVSLVGWNQEKLVRVYDKKRVWCVTPERLWLGVTHGGVQR